MPDEQKAHFTQRRCYKMVTLLHMSRDQDFYFFVVVKVFAGNDHECPILYNLIKQFVEAVGKGVISWTEVFWKVKPYLCVRENTTPIFFL